MNRGQKLIGNLSAQDIILLVAAGILFTLVLVVILSYRAAGSGRPSWFDEILSRGPIQATSTPVSPFLLHRQPVQVIPPQIETNCTYPSDYWRTHTEVWAIENIVLGQASFSKASILELLNNESREPNRELYKQFFTTALNTMKGAEAEVITEVLGRSRRWLEVSEPGSQVARENVLDVLIMAEALEGYNTGIIGPGPCEFQEVVVLPTPTPVVLPPAPPQAQDPGVSPTATSTLTAPQSLPSATPTPPPPATATQAPLRTATPTRTQAPASTATLRSSPTTAPLPGATATPTESAPTATSAPPTSAPPPTNPAAPTDTPAPTASATLTSVPTPTSAPTATEAPTATQEPSPTATVIPPPTSAPTDTEAPTEPPPPTATIEPTAAETEPFPTGAVPPGPVAAPPTPGLDPTGSSP
jgi:hypothetical protein